MTPDDAGWAAAEEPLDAGTLPDVAGGGSMAPIGARAAGPAFLAASTASASVLPSAFASSKAFRWAGVEFGNAARNAAD